MILKIKIPPAILCTLIVTCFLQTTVRCSFRNTIHNRKRIVEKRSNKDTNKFTGGKGANSLKLALLDAIGASSDEDFDLIDVIYAVAKTYKGQYHSCSQSSNNTKQNEFVPRKAKRKRKNKRSLYHFGANDASRAVPIDNNKERKSEKNVSWNNYINNIFEDIISSPKAESRIANYFNLPVADQFLGFLAIPTNQALAELALKQMEWFAFLFVSHIFDTNASGEEETME